LERELYENQIKVLEKLQLLFQKYHEETRKIFITCEKFGELDNNYVFYNLFAILDEIYIIFKKPDMENFENRMKYIKSNFLIAQNYAIAIGVTAILDKLKYKNNKLSEKILNYERFLRTILKKSKININDYNDYKKNIIEQLREITNNEKIIKIFINTNNELKDLFINVIELNEIKWNLLDKCEGENNKTIRKIGSLNEEQIETFSDFFTTKYGITRLVLFDVLRRRGSHYKFTVTELRDALNHIAKSILFKDNDFNTEIIYAFEHIRRAAVESIQHYCEERLFEIDSLLSQKTSDQFFENLSKISKIKKFFCLGRYEKGETTWSDSILYFYKALELIEKVKINANQM
jgi:hypothetical protein